MGHHHPGGLPCLPAPLRAGRGPCPLGTPSWSLELTRIVCPRSSGQSPRSLGTTTSTRVRTIWWEDLGTQASRAPEAPAPLGPGAPALPSRTTPTPAVFQTEFVHAVKQGLDPGRTWSPGPRPQRPRSRPSAYTYIQGFHVFVELRLSQNLSSSEKIELSFTSLPCMESSQSEHIPLLPATPEERKQDVHPLRFSRARQ